MLKRFISDSVKKIITIINRPVIDEIQKVNKNINFIVNQTLDINNIKTMPSIRHIQEGQYKVLEVIDACFEELDLEYFLIFGTLLGAVRHKGFVPWDDDIDIAIMQEDFNALLNHEERLNENGLYFSSPLSIYGTYNGKGWHKIYDSNKQFYVSLFVLDLVNTNDILTYMSHRAKYNDMARDHTTSFRLGRYGIEEMKKNLLSLREEYYSNPIFVNKKEIGGDTYLVKDIFSHYEPTFTKAEYLYPLSKAVFAISEEDMKEFTVPNRPEKMLEDYYSKDYTCFPSDLYPKHTHNW